MVRAGSSVEWLKDIDQQDAYTVGQRIAQLGEQFSLGVPFAPSFVIPNNVYLSFLRFNNLEKKINHLLSTIHYDDQRSVSQVSHHITNIIRASQLMPEAIQELQAFYKQLSGALTHASVSIQAFPVTLEAHLPPLAGHTIQGEAAFVESIKETYSQMFSPAYLLRLHELKRTPFQITVALLVSKILSPEVSGVMFTTDPVYLNKDRIVIEAVYGLKELFMEGMLTPDHYEIDRNSGKMLEKFVAAQDTALMVHGSTTKKVKISRFQQKKPKLVEKQLQQLVHLGNQVQRALYFPQDIEWCLEKGVFYVTSLRQLPNEQQEVPDHKRLSARMRVKPLLAGIAHGKGIHSGMVKIVRSAKDVEKVYAGDILVVPHITYDLIPTIKRAGAVISEYGGLSSSPLGLQNFGKPMVSGVTQATQLLKQGMVATVNGMTGEIFRGSVLSLEKDVQEYDLKEYVKTKTQIIAILEPGQNADIDQAADGAVITAGKVIKEFGIHPRKLLREGDSEILSNKIDIELSHAYDSMYRYVVFYQLSDLTPTEYQKLHGGKEYESFETDAVLGYRGAYRLLHEPDILDIELTALKQFQARHRPAALNIIFPTVRTKAEVLMMEKKLRSGLPPSSRYKVWLKVDTPMVALSMDTFLHNGIEGVVLDVKILATLLTGMGSEVDEYARLRSMENPVLEAFILKVIKTIHTSHKKVLISGIDTIDTELFEWIVQQKVDGIILPQLLLERAHKKVLQLEERSNSHG